MEDYDDRTDPAHVRARSLPLRDAHGKHDGVGSKGLYRAAKSGCASAVAVALTLFAGTAKADLPVIDPTSIAQLAKTFGVETEQLTTLLNQLRQLQQTYQQTVWIYNSLAHGTNVNQIAALLNSPYLRNSMPGSAMLPGTITGMYAPSTLGGGWSGNASTWLGYNQVYMPASNQGWQAQQMQRNANYIASVQAMAQQNLQSLEQRQAALADIQAQIDSAKDVQGVAAVQARLQAENNYVAAQAAQAQNLAILAQAQQNASEQAQQQKESQDIDTARSYLCTNLNSLGSSVSVSCSQQ